MVLIGPGAPMPLGEDEFQRLLALAEASANALRRAQIGPQSGAPPGWLVIQRLDRKEVLHAVEDGGDHHGEEELYEQIWLTTDGRLRSARRSVKRCHRAEHPGGEFIPLSESSQLGPWIASSHDISGPRWDGEYGPTSQRTGRIETIVHDEPRGPREHPATRIARALESMTPWLIEAEERRGSIATVPAATVRGRTFAALSVGMFMVLLAGTAALLVLIFVLYSVFTTPPGNGI